MTSRGNYIKVFTRLFNLLGNRKYSLLIECNDEEKINIVDDLLAVAEDDDDHVTSPGDEIEEVPKVLITVGLPIQVGLEKILNNEDLAAILMFHGDDANIQQLDIKQRPKFMVGTNCLDGKISMYITHVVRKKLPSTTPSAAAISASASASSLNLEHHHPLQEEDEDPKIDEEEERWFNNVKDTVLDLLISASCHDRYDFSIDFLTSVSKDVSWKAAFTHVTFDPEFNRNYETLETLGDKVMSVAFINLLINEESISQRGGKYIDSNVITDIHKEILSHDNQCKMGRTVGFDRLIRSLVAPDVSIIEDVTEAFFGNLFSLTNRLTNGTQGSSLCTIVFHHIFKKAFQDMNVFEIDKDPKTILDQMFPKLDWGKPEFIYHKTSSTSVIKFPLSAVNNLKKDFVDTLPVNRIIATYKGQDKKDAEKKASIIALNFLRDMWGVDRKYVKKFTHEKMILDPRYQNAHLTALQKASKQGYDNIYVQRKAKRRVQYYIVMGVKQDIETAVFAYRSQDGKPEGNIDGHIHALLAYSA